MVTDLSNAFQGHLVFRCFIVCYEYRMAPFRNKSIDKWQRKTQVTTGAAAFKGNLKAFNQDISEQVADYMRNPSKMIKSMQLHRATVGVFGAVPDVVGAVKEKDANAGDPELLDD